MDVVPVCIAHRASVTIHEILDVIMLLRKIRTRKTQEI
jgi:hypothetical protein